MSGACFMDAALRILPVEELTDALEELEAEAALEGFNFLGRLIGEWRAGTNRFDRPGERLLGAYVESRLVAVSGLNIDPFSTSRRIGRLRRLYVSRCFRRRGVGAALVARLLDEAAGVFDVLRLRTESADAAAFYLRCGFSPVEEAAATHAKRIAS